MKTSVRPKIITWAVAAGFIAMLILIVWADLADAANCESKKTEASCEVHEIETVRVLVTNMHVFPTPKRNRCGEDSTFKFLSDVEEYEGDGDDLPFDQYRAYGGNDTKCFDNYGYEAICTEMFGRNAYLEIKINRKKKIPKRDGIPRGRVFEIHLLGYAEER